MEKNMQERSVKAAARYMERRGYKVLDTHWKAEGADDEIDLTAMDGDTLVITKVRFAGNDVDGFAEEEIDKADFERLAVAYLEQHDLVDVYVRLDIVTVLAVGEDRALLRHHRGACGAAD